MGQRKSFSESGKLIDYDERLEDYTDYYPKSPGSKKEEISLDDLLKDIQDIRNQLMNTYEPIKLEEGNCLPKDHPLRKKVEEINRCLSETGYKYKVVYDPNTVGYTNKKEDTTLNFDKIPVLIVTFQKKENKFGYSVSILKPGSENKDLYDRIKYLMDKSVDNRFGRETTFDDRHNLI